MGSHDTFTSGMSVFEPLISWTTCSLTKEISCSFAVVTVVASASDAVVFIKS